MPMIQVWKSPMGLQILHRITDLTQSSMAHNLMLEMAHNLMRTDYM